MPRMPISRKVPDLLHLLLRTVGHLYWHTAQRHCASEKGVLALHDWMKAVLGVVCNSKKRVQKKQDEVSIARRKESFIGRECLQLLKQHEQLMEHIYEDMLEGNQPEEKVQAQLAWTAFSKLWKALTDRIPSEAGKFPSEADRAAKAREVQVLADVFCGAFAAASGLDDNASIYTHVIKCHLADAVKEFGNLMDFSCQGSEHVHVIVKRTFKLTNGHESDRLWQAMVQVALERESRKFLPDVVGKKRGRAYVYEAHTLQPHMEVVPNAVLLEKGRMPA